MPQEWDDTLVPPLTLNEQTVRHTRGKLQNVQSHLKNVAPHSLSLKLIIFRARQLAKIQPIFQRCLPPEMQQHIYIATIGKQFWVIGASNALVATRFKFHSKTVRLAMQQYLRREVPDFFIKVYPNIHLPSSNPPASVRRSLSVNSAQAIQQAANQITHPGLKKILYKIAGYQ